MTAVVLAAGGGERMGRTKMLAPFRGRPLLEWTLQLVQQLSVPHRVLVLGSEAEKVRGAVPATGWRIIVNPVWEEGMSSSLRAAEAVAPKGGLLVFLGDMPCIPKRACEEVISRAGQRPVAPSYRGQRGFPVYIPPPLRGQLQNLQGDEGARSMLAQCEHIPQQQPGVLWDIDRPEELACETWNSLM